MIQTKSKITGEIGLASLLALTGLAGSGIVKSRILEPRDNIEVHQSGRVIRANGIDGFCGLLNAGELIYVEGPATYLDSNGTVLGKNSFDTLAWLNPRSDVFRRGWGKDYEYRVNSLESYDFKGQIKALMNKDSTGTDRVSSGPWYSEGSRVALDLNTMQDENGRPAERFNPKDYAIKIGCRPMTIPNSGK
jgi:hypothetical protein